MAGGDSLSLGQFLDVSLDAAPRDHSTVSRTRRRIDVETHLAVFTWVQRRLADAGLVGGKTVGLDATTLEANAALRSIVRRDTGGGYETFLRQLAVASGIATPTRAELARLDRKRPKMGSNDDWTHPKDPDAKVKKMKDGRTRLAHKAEHAVDLDAGAVVGVSAQDADAGDTATMLETLVEDRPSEQTGNPATLKPVRTRQVAGERSHDQRQFGASTTKPCERAVVVIGGIVMPHSTRVRSGLLLSDDDAESRSRPTTTAPPGSGSLLELVPLGRKQTKCTVRRHAEPRRAPHRSGLPARDGPGGANACRLRVG